MSMASVIVLVVEIRLVQIFDTPFTRFGTKNVWDEGLLCFGKRGIENEEGLDDAVGVGGGGRVADDGAGEGGCELGGF
jgi:hypothetical protein